MSKLLKLSSKEKKVFHFPLPAKYEKVRMLYYSLINAGYTTCRAFHESMKLLIIISPHIKLSEISKKTFDIIKPINDNYYEINIDNYSQN